MKKIKQINIADHGFYPFSPKLIKRYNFESYTNIDEPCFFWGAIGEVDKINNHRGLKIIKFLTPADCWVINSIMNTENLFIISDPFIETNVNYNFVNIEFEISDFKIFEPIILKDKIYCYMRDPFEFRKDIINNIQRKIDYEIIYGGENCDAKNYYSPIDLKSMYYDNCFLSINLSSKHGFTTVKELGCMGIKTIMYSPYNFPSIVQLNHYERDFKSGGHTIRVNEDEIVEKINIESFNIGKKGISMNPHNIDDRWLNVDFWENKEYIKYTSNNYKYHGKN